MTFTRILVCSLLCGWGASAVIGQEPSAADVCYGPHDRNVLDFWRAESDQPSPVLIYFHGGGFRGGDKRSFRNRAGAYLQAGISVVSANYRYSRQAAYPGPMLDGARAVQWVKSRAKEWNIDVPRTRRALAFDRRHAGRPPRGRS